MNPFNWWKNRRSASGTALALYRRGMTKANMHDSSGAASDYTAVVEMRDAPADVVAMALYNRALLHAAAGDDAKATEDLTAVLGTAAPLRRVKSAARQKLERMHHRQAKGSATRFHSMSV